MARISWDLGGRSVGWLQESVDLKTWTEPPGNLLGPSGHFDEPIEGPRKFFRIRIETNS
jgi:hypothetical protein